MAVETLFGLPDRSRVSGLAKKYPWNRSKPRNMQSAYLAGSSTFSASSSAFGNISRERSTMAGNSAGGMASTSSFTTSMSGATSASPGRSRSTTSSRAKRRPVS
jgi:hypothetical protein